MIEIHEFSTGIQYERTSDGGWQSRGFTGQFINRTLDPIPRIIEKAISDKEFGIAEGTVTDIPALIGREVSQNEEAWSVLAVIIRGSDEFGRHFPAYRYFYTQGKGNLDELVRWWENNNKLEFNPFDEPQVRHYETKDAVEVPLDNFQDILKATPPIILPTDKPLRPLIIHTIAQRVASDSDIAWAYNIGGLEYPKSFHAIYPDSEKAAELISRAIRSQPASSGIIRGENSIKLAIQNLINKEEVNVEYLQTLETALNNPQINDKLWQSYFNGKGADQAISQEIYNPNMIRLLTLRAIILPTTLSQFLEWLEAGSKDKTNAVASLNFQQEILKKASGKTPKLADKVIAGVKIIIFQLLDKPELLQPTVWLLGSPESIWCNLYDHEVKKQIEHDLSLMSDSAKAKKAPKKPSNNESLWAEKENIKTGNYEPLLTAETTEKKEPFYIAEWEPIWKQIKVFWNPGSADKMPQYLPLAKLFEQLGNSKLSAVFYQIATGSVPKTVFKEVSNRGYYSSVFKLKIAKYVSPLELFGLTLLTIGQKIMPVYLVIPLVIFGIILGGVGGFFAKSIIGDNTKKPENPTTTSGDSVNSQKQSLKNAGLEINKAEKSSEQTYKALTDLIKTNDPEKTTKKGKLVGILNKTLKANKDKYADVQNLELKSDDLDKNNFGDKKDQENWIKAIFLYQKDNKGKKAKNGDPIGQPDGTIAQNGATFKLLKEQMEKKTPSPQPSPTK